MLDRSQKFGRSSKESRGVGSYFDQSNRLFLLVVLLCMSSVSSAQNYLTSTGTPAFAAPEPAEYGFVDASSGNLHLELPIGSYPQRGTNRPARIEFTSGANKLWSVMTTGGPAPYWNADTLGAWSVLQLEGTLTGSADGNSQCIFDYTYTEPTGTQHPFPPNNADCGGPLTDDSLATDS